MCGDDETKSHGNAQLNITTSPRSDRMISELFLFWYTYFLVGGGDENILLRIVT